MSMLMLGFLGLSAMPIADGKVDFDDDQTAKLADELTPESLQTLIDAFNKDLAENDGVKSINSQIEGLLAEMRDAEEEGANAKDEGGDPPGDSATAADKDIMPQLMLI